MRIITIMAIGYFYNKETIHGKISRAIVTVVIFITEKRRFYHRLSDVSVVGSNYYRRFHRIFAAGILITVIKIIWMTTDVTVIVN